MVRKSRPLLCFLWFPEGPDHRSARAGAIETPCFTPGLGSKIVVFFSQFHARSWYLWRRNRSKRCQKSCLNTKSWKVYVFFVPVLFLAALCPHYGPPLRSQKRWTRKQWYPTMSGGHWRFKVIAFSRIGGPRPSRKRQFSMLVAQSHAI